MGSAYGSKVDGLKTVDKDIIIVDKQQIPAKESIQHVTGLGNPKAVPVLNIIPLMVRS